MTEGRTNCKGHVYMGHNICLLDKAYQQVRHKLTVKSISSSDFSRINSGSHTNMISAAYAPMSWGIIGTWKTAGYMHMKTLNVAAVVFQRTCSYYGNFFLSCSLSGEQSLREKLIHITNINQSINLYLNQTKAYRHRETYRHTHACTKQPLTCWYAMSRRQMLCPIYTCPLQFIRPSVMWQYSKTVYMWRHCL